MKFAFSVCFLFLLIGVATHAQEAVGTWKDHLNYTDAADVAELDNKIYVATRNAIFIYNKLDNSLEKLNKINGLTDVGIEIIRSYPEANLLFVGYENGNIDLVSGKTVTNFPDLRMSNIIGDKSVRHISFYNGFGYISTGLGILAFDIDRREIRDTYGILSNGAISINETTILNDTLYAATNEGLYYGSLGSDLSIFSNWTLDLSTPLPFGNIAHCAGFNGRLFINVPGAPQPGLYMRTGGSDWLNVNGYADINSLRETPLGLMYATPNTAEVKAENGIDVLVSFFIYDGLPSNISEAIADAEGNLWMSDRTYGLVKRPVSGVFEFIAPAGPSTNESFALTFQQDQLWISAGRTARPGQWSNSNSLKGFYGLRNGQWTNFTVSSFPILGTNVFADITDVHVDYTNPNRIYVGSWLSGLLEIENDQVTTYYTPDNSTLAPRVQFVRPDGQPWVGVTGFAQDKNNNLWMCNGFSEVPLSVKKADGSWKGFNLNNLVPQERAVVDMIINRDGHKWMIINQNGLVVFHEKENIDDDDFDVRVLNAATGSGGLPTADVFCIAEDLDGQIWVGTSDGLAVFFSPFDVFSDNPSDARQILVEQDGIFQFLFETQLISAIAVDGANRKWIGTFGSGLFLMSADGTEEIRSFTKENSPLLNNIINDIEIDPRTGDVHIATQDGVMTYTSDAREGFVSNDCTSVYPNPVRETYTGPISITGLKIDTDVRITDVRGNLVYATKSNGGVAIWDGKNLNNQRVATGVYFALSSDGEGESTCVSKIMVIR